MGVAEKHYGEVANATQKFLDTLETHEQKEAFKEFVYQLILCINDNRNEFVDFANADLVRWYLCRE